MKILLSIIFFYSILNANIDKGIKSNGITVQHSVIVLIDIWDQKFLDEIVIKKINPFIEYLKNNNYLIIFAPSQGIENKKLIQISDYKIYNNDDLYPILKKHNIKNVFYAGFDTLLCILDKPAGILNMKQKYKEFNYYLIKDITVSQTKEMKTVALNILRNNSVSIVNTDYFTKHIINTMEFNYPYTLDLHIQENILKGNKPLVVLYKNNINDFKAYQLILEQHNIDVVSIVNDDIYHNGLKENNIYKFIEYIKLNHITDIVFGGYYANEDILYGEISILNLYMKKRYSNISLPKNHILKNLFFINNEYSNISNKEIKAVIINKYRDVGYVALSTITNRKHYKTTQNIARKTTINTTIAVFNKQDFYLLLLLITITVMFIFIKNKRK